MSSSSSRSWKEARNSNNSFALLIFWLKSKSHTSFPTIATHSYYPVAGGYTSDISYLFALLLIDQPYRSSKGAVEAPQHSIFTNRAGEAEKG